MHPFNAEQQIADVRKDITECKEELQQAKIIRKNRQGMNCQVFFSLPLPEKKRFQSRICKEFVSGADRGFYFTPAVLNVLCT